MKPSLAGLLKTFVVFFVFLVAFAGCKAEVSGGYNSGKRITITYVDESGNILKTDSETSYGSVELYYTKTGYICTYYDSNGKMVETKYSRTYYKTESDCKIIVKFTPIKYTIKFEKKSSYSVSVEGNLPESIECVYDTEYVLPKNELTCTANSIEYKPRGWTKNYNGYSSDLYSVGEFSDDEKVKNLTTIDGATVTLYACFSNEDRYVLTFYKDDTAYYPSTALIYADKDDIIGNDKVPEAKSKTGYNFDGYYLSADESKNIVDFDTYKVAGNATFKPSYSYATYTATFVSEYGTVPESLTWTYSPIYSSVNSTDISTGIYKLSTTGYNFDGWYQENGRYGIVRIYHNYTSDIIFTAKWVPWTATLYYYTNSPSDAYVSSSINSANLTYGKEMNISEDKLYASGYRFLGWNTKSDGTGISYSPGDSFTWKGGEDNERVNLYAQWKQLQTKMNIDLKNAYDNADIDISYDVDSQCLKAAFRSAGKFVPSSWTWYIDGKKVEYETTSALSVYAFSEGIHTVMVTADYSGRTYGLTITINATVEE